MSAENKIVSAPNIVRETGNCEEKAKTEMKMKQAVSDFDDLKLKYIDSQSQNKILMDKLSEAEKKLKSLEEALEPAVEEFDQMRKKYDIEQCCRSEAEKYASKLKKENRVLKRQSQLLIMKLQPMASDLKEVMEDDLNEHENEDISDTTDKTSQIQEDPVHKPTPSERNKNSDERVRELERKLEISQQREQILDEELKKFSRVSHMVWQECNDAKNRCEQASKLKNEAEKFAHQMLSERDAVIRQSSILLASTNSDRRIIEALTTIEDLTKALEMEKLSRKKEVSELKETLKSLETGVQLKAIEELRSQLQFAVEENERSQKTMQELEAKISRMEEENEILRLKLQVCEDRLKPPSPPPPPPPTSVSRFNPLRLFSKKSKKVNQTVKEEVSRNKNYEEAIKEMMDRIRSGQALKATKTNQNDVIEEKPSVAMNDLQKMLSSLKSTQEKTLSTEEEDKEVSASNVDDQCSSERQQQLRGLQCVETTDNTSVAVDTKSNELIETQGTCEKSLEENCN